MQALAAAALLCILLLGASGGCGDEPVRDAGLLRLPDASGRPELRTLKVGALPIADLKQLFVADAKGFFRQEGLEVDITHFEGGAAIVPAVESGSVDLGWSNSASMLQARARGLDFRFFAGGVYQGPGHWTSALMVPESSPLRSAAQLQGRTVALNTLANINELVLRAYLDRAGIEPEAAKPLEVPFPDQPVALDAGRVDAALPSEPFVTAARRSGARVLDARPFAAIGKRPFVAAFFAKTDWLREHPNTVAAFRRAVGKATRYWDGHPQERAAIIARYTELPAALGERMTYGEPRTSIAEADIQRLIELSHRYGLLSRTFDAREVLAR
jgi:NitT/TauT family transport system substrate-binding protein